MFRLFKTFFFALIIGALSILSGCLEEDGDSKSPKVSVTTSTATSVKATSAILGGVISGDVIMAGVLIDTSTKPSTQLGRVEESTDISGSFTMSVTDLEPGTTYYYQAVAVTEDDEFFGDVLSFTTLDEADVAPKVTSSSILKSATEVASSTDLVVTFSAQMDEDSFEDKIVMSYQSGSVLAYPDFTYSVSGTKLTIKPTNGWRGGKTVNNVMINIGVKDLDGNELLETYQNSFTTENAAPTVVSISPTDKANSVDVTSSIVITFSENLDSWYSSGFAFSLKDASGAAPQATTNISGNKVTINPTNDLTEFSSVYTVTVGATGGSIVTENGDYFEGTNTYTFTTVIAREDYYYVFESVAHSGTYKFLGLHDEGTTRGNGYRNLLLSRYLSVATATLWRPILTTYNGSPAVVWVNKLDETYDHWGKSYPQALYNYAANDGDSELYSNPVEASGVWWNNQKWNITSGKSSGTGYSIYSYTGGSYLEAESFDSKTSTSSGSFNWKIAKYEKYTE